MRRLAAFSMFALAAACNTPEKPVEKAPQAPAVVAEPVRDPNDAELTVDAAVIAEGSKLTYQLTTSVREPWVIKDTTPFAVTLQPSDGVTPAKAKLGKEDFVDTKAAAKVVRTALTATAGEHTVRADVDMFVCSAELCERKQLRVDTSFTAADK